MSEEAFELVATPSHADLVEDGVQLALLDDATLEKIFDGRIFIVSDPMSRPEESLPLLTIFTPSEARDYELQDEALVRLPVGIAIWYDENRRYRERGEKSVKTLVNHIIAVLRADQRLDTSTGLGPEPLTEMITGTDSLDFGSFFEKSDDGEVFCVGMYRQIIFDYQYGIDNTTGVKA